MAEKMTLAEALLADSCTFPSHTQALHRVAAPQLKKLTQDVDDMAEVVAQLEAENDHLHYIIEHLTRLLPNNQEALDLVKDIYQSTEGN